MSAIGFADIDTCAKAVLIHRGEYHSLVISPSSAQAELLFFSGRIFRKSLLLGRLSKDTNRTDYIDDERLMFDAIRRWKDRTHTIVEGAYVALFSWSGRIYLIRGVYDSPAIYYINTGPNIFISTDVEVLINRLPQPLVVDSHVIKHFLAFSTNCADQTPFKDLHSLAAGQGISIGKNADVHPIEINIPLQSTHSTDSSGSTSQWRDAMLDALGELGSGYKSIALFLSGGIDSGALAVFAKQLGLPINAVNMSIPDFPEEDEWQYANGLANKIGVPCHRKVVRGNCFDNILSTPISLISPGINPYQELINAGYDCVHEIGAPVVWTGTGGDEIYAPPRNALRDAWYDRSWHHLRQLTLSRKSRSTPHLYKTWINGLLKRQSRKIRFPDFILGDSNGDEGHCRNPEVVGNNVDDTYHRSLIFQFNHVNAGELESVNYSNRGFLRAHPYMHPAIIETGLGTPAHLAHSADFNKMIMRQALSSIAPHDFVWRQRVGVLNRYYFTGWSKNLAKIKSILLDKHESWSLFVDRDKVVDALGSDNGDRAMLLLNCLSLQLWLNKLRSMNLLYIFR